MRGGYKGYLIYSTFLDLDLEFTLGSFCCSSSSAIVPTVQFSSVSLSPPGVNSLSCVSPLLVHTAWDGLSSSLLTSKVAPSPRVGGGQTRSKLDRTTPERLQSPTELWLSFCATCAPASSLSATPSLPASSNYSEHKESKNMCWWFRHSRGRKKCPD